jgi:hypothetical protein
VIRRLCAFVLLLGCPASDDDGGRDDAANDTTGGASATESTGALCGMCGADEACHSEIDASGHCICEAGHEWADPQNDEDFTCVPVADTSGGNVCLAENHAMIVDEMCVCEPGYEWCTTDPDDFTCCEA